MARRKKSKGGVPITAQDISNIAKSNPYLQKVMSDAKLRKNVRTAVASSKKAYGRVANGKLNPQKLLEDKKLHADMSRALGASRDAAITLTHTSRKRARSGRKATRRVLIVVVGSGAALAGSEKLRSKVLDMLFGAEEEFQYTPPANSTSSEPTTTVGGAA
jgi:hypothetical protein